MRTRRRAAWLALALALLLAQALGHWHRVAHALPSAAAHDHDHGHSHGHGHGHAFDDHAAGDAECRLLDQLGQTEGLAWALPPRPAPGLAPRPAVQALREARLAPGWRQRARGPPQA